ncbi:MAG: hypothetical protein Q3979_02075 [Actinomycetaceae bacterium]|nr:hypothetical protein [Actinomycetaceae bacterium]
MKRRNDRAAGGRATRARARVPGQRPSAEQILTRVATLNLLTVTAGTLLVCAALVLAGRGQMALGALVGSALVVATFALDLFFVRHERFDGPVRVVGFLVKLVVFALGAWGAIRFGSVDRAAIAWSVFAGIVASLVVSSWVVLRGEGPDFDMLEREDRRNEGSSR